VSWRNAEANIFPEEGICSNLDLCDDVTQGGLRNGSVTHIILSLTDLKEIILATAQVLLNFKHTDLYQCDIRLHCRDGIFKLRRSPGMDSKESIPPANVAWRAGVTTLFYLVPIPHSLF
jgi:hypothetical protein